MHDYLFIITLGFLHAVSQGKEESIEFYNNWNNQVISSVPEDRLIIIENTKMNWNKICRFLNLQIPPENIKFPNCESIIGTKRLMTMGSPSFSTTYSSSSSSSSSSSEVDENSESNLNEIDEPNEIEESRSLENDHSECKF